MDKAALLKDLRKQVTSLEDDMRADTEPGQQFHAKLQAEYTQARERQRTALTFGQWRDDRVTQAAVAWILATVFVRFCEDNDLIAEPWIAGPGERLIEADERHQQFFRDHPDKNDRDWLIAAFTHLEETNETVAGLFDRDHNPLWELKPSYEKAADLLKFWRRLDADGQIVHDFTDKENLDTRFLGDLYQDLSDHAKKTYALLQTPEFVEEFILDLTLEPAIEEFGLEPPWKHKPTGWPGDEPIVYGLRTIDPACGSGHFLLGIFHRLLAKWREKDIPGLDEWGRIRKVLESIHGCDKNPFAAEIARFRLLVAALHAAGEIRLDTAPVFPINVAVGDSLLHGRGAEIQTGMLFGNDEQFTYSTEDVQEFAKRCDLLGVGSYHVVVANPPYIVAKDKQENENYRAYSAASGQYALSVPFAQRIFELALRTGGSDRAAGFTGQITSNSFMKREFGRKLIPWFHENVDLTHVIDTSGAHIPGHGTPTVILAGRNRTALKDNTIRAVLGLRGEPAQPENAAEGLVWTAIVEQCGRPSNDSEWVDAVDLGRSMLSVHPWSLSGGGARELVEQLEAKRETLAARIELPIGRAIRAGADEAYMRPFRDVRRRHSARRGLRPLILGDAVRDWCAAPTDAIVYPYSPDVSLSELQAELLPWKSTLASRRTFQGDMAAAGLQWWDYMQHTSSAYKTPLSIVFAFVSTHNHFILDRGGRVFNRSAPAIKLPVGAGEDEHLGILGLLNSSLACFWLKQVSHDKGIRGEGGGFTSAEWERFFEFTGMKLQNLPISESLPLTLGRELDEFARQAASVEAHIVADDFLPSRAQFDEQQKTVNYLRWRMVMLQEELDWRVYGSYGLLSSEDVARATTGDVETVPEVRLGERAFEIVMARRLADGGGDDEWFVRHRSKPVTEIPERWPEEYRRVVQARIELIEKLPKGVGLIERPEYKRRWASEPWEKKEKAALRNWILDRCEREDLWFGLRDGFRQPRTLTVNQLADQFKDDADMQSVAALYASDHLGKRDLPLAKVLAEVLADEHVPFLAALRYKDTGLRKREEWEQVWELQREEDRTGKRLDIAVPPKYAPKDFQKNSYWSQRGKLDVPKERFISYPGASPDADDSLLLGWAGWDHKDQAQALANLVNDRAEVGAWDAEKLTPLLAGLLEVLPWVKQWHGEEDAEWGGVPADEFDAFLHEQLGRYELSEQDLKGWRPPAKGRGRKKA
ncbi:BREX-2 system adenine-specific DNA-methyltransferase PglX [Actinomadura decatromicini]|uniref:BREX-2 system adenine-specific DNA-methyltransferase PglX n=1 Tax=Actinomadura decatromicini TaxID=2604572 RepID=UPI001FE8F4C4|nr:BREX-2 system adenine-specific DNA-methyltransferase PglX [Actinomadura decatromicini]